MAKFSQLFGYLSSQEISIGLENENEEGIKHTLKLYNAILREYSKDGSNKWVNISAPLTEDEDYFEQDNDTLGLKLECAAESTSKENSSQNKSGDQSGDQSESNLSKSVNVKENEKEKQFISSISSVLPLVIQLIKDEIEEKLIETSYGWKIKGFGSMKLEALEMIRIITSKFWFQVKDELIKANIFKIALNLFQKYPNNSMMHSKIEEIITFSLKTGGEEIVEEIMHKNQLINYIIELTDPNENNILFEATTNTIHQGYFAHIINISNELVKIAKDNVEIQNTLDSIPEWTNFQEGILKERNDLLEGDLGGRDPRAKPESPFDDKDFLGRFKGFKPVPFASIKNRRK